MRAVPAVSSSATRPISMSSGDFQSQCIGLDFGPASRLHIRPGVWFAFVAVLSFRILSSLFPPLICQSIFHKNIFNWISFLPPPPPLLTHGVVPSHSSPLLLSLSLPFTFPLSLPYFTPYAVPAMSSTSNATSLMDLSSGNCHLHFKMLFLLAILFCRLHPAGKSFVRVVFICSTTPNHARLPLCIVQA